MHVSSRVLNLSFNGLCYGYQFSERKALVIIRKTCEAFSQDMKKK